MIFRKKYLQTIVRWTNETRLRFVFGIFFVLSTTKRILTNMRQCIDENKTQLVLKFETRQYFHSNKLPTSDTHVFSIWPGVVTVLRPFSYFFPFCCDNVQFSLFWGITGTPNRKKSRTFCGSFALSTNGTNKLGFMSFGLFGPVENN